MALAAVKDGRKDVGQIIGLAKRLTQSQVKHGVNAGGWSYG
jgi:hypothetical protein